MSETRGQGRIAKSLPTEGREEVRDAEARSDRAPARRATREGRRLARPPCDAVSRDGDDRPDGQQDEDAPEDVVDDAVGALRRGVERASTSLSAAARSSDKASNAALRSCAIVSAIAWRSEDA